MLHLLCKGYPQLELLHYLHRVPAAAVWETLSILLTNSALFSFMSGEVEAVGPNVMQQVVPRNTGKVLMALLAAREGK